MKGYEREVSSPYFHDLITSVLVYDAREVRRILQKKFPDEELLTKARLYVARKEFPLLKKHPEPLTYPFYFVDVVWFVSLGEKGSIVHEVKTGKKWKGAWLKFFDTSTVFNGYPIIPEHKRTLFCLWVWKEYYYEAQPPNRVKICFIDWIFPILKRRMYELIRIIKKGDVLCPERENTQKGFTSPYHMK